MSKRLRIVSVCRTLPTPDDPSSGVFVLNRLRAMSASADVVAVQPIPYFPGVKPLPDWTRRERHLDGLRVIHAPMLYVPGVLKSADGLWLARAVSAVIERLHADSPLDAIDAHFGYPEGVGCARVARKLGVPYFVTVRGVENEYVARPPIAGQMLGALRGAAGCISVSHSLRDVIVRHGVDPSRVKVVHNAIDSSVFRTGDRDAARRAVGVPAEVPLIVSVGHLVSRKRHHVLVDAFARIVKSRPDARLAIIGARAFERRYPDDLIALAARLGIGHAVRLVGNIPPLQVADWLRAADVFALATAREGCCNAVLEALACGVPVVTTGAGDNAHFVENGTNGAIVPVDDAESLAAAIDAALGRAWDRAAIAARLAREVGDWSAVAGRVLEFIDERRAAREAVA